MNLPNILSISRVVFVFMMFILINNIPIFISLYILSCLSDIFDGYLARKLNQVSKLGQKLDSFGDLILYLSTIYFLYYFKPNIINEYLVFIFLIVIIRIINIIIGYLKHKKFLVYHTYLNKTTGLLYAILFPIIILSNNPQIFLFLIIFLAFISSLEETYILTFKNISNADYKGLLFK